MLQPSRARGAGSGRRGLAGTLAACALLIAGCATGADPEVAGPTDDQAPPPRASAGPVPSGSSPTGTTQTAPSEDDVEQPQPTDAPGVLTEQDSGSQIVLAVGEERPLQLGSAWSWSEPAVDGRAVTLTPVDFLVDPGYVEWLVTGTAAGSATLEVVGEPVCGDTTVCPPTTVTLDVEVTG